MLNLRHVRSKAGVMDVRWALGLFVGAPWRWSGIANARTAFDIPWGESLCSCVPPKKLLAGCGVVWEGEHLQALLPLNTKGDDAADTEASELGSRASGFQKKRRRRPKGVVPPLWRVTALTKGPSDLRVQSHGRTEDRAAR